VNRRQDDLWGNVEGERRTGRAGARIAFLDLLDLFGSGRCAMFKIVNGGLKSMYKYIYI
jgi:hypothetical protein